MSLTNQSGFILTNQESAYWTNQTVKICDPHLYEDGPKTRYGVFCPCKPVPLLAQGVHFPFPPKTEDCVFWLS